MDDRTTSSSSFYDALESNVVKVDDFPKEIDVSSGGPYANYNWELLFHIPLADRRASEQEPALRRGAALVPLHLRSDRNDTTSSRAFWKFLALPQTRKSRRSTSCWRC